jgi:hypothetical protein
MNTAINPWGTVSRESCQPLSSQALCRSETIWLRHDPGRGAWLDKAGFDPFVAPAEMLACWLTERGARYELELRVGSSGQHAGVWFGLTALGATPREAARLARDGGRVLMDSVSSFRWKVRRCVAPALPRGVRHLGRGPTERPLMMPGPAPFYLTVLPKVARKGSPVVLRFRVTHRGGDTGLFSEARRLRDLAITSREHEASALRATRVIDQTAGLGVEISLHARRLPGEVPSRLLASALTQDLEASLQWGEEPVRLEASHALLRHLINLLSVSERRAPPGLLDALGEDMPF